MSRIFVVSISLSALAWSCTTGAERPRPPVLAPVQSQPTDAGTGFDRDPLVAYEPPVVAPVGDGFRPPASVYGPGNRGIEYDTYAGQAVSAAGEGVVVFAGPVAGTVAVAISHADGLRTTYTHLTTIDVRVGDHVIRGASIGKAGELMHFGARLGLTYLDPEGLFESMSGPARLVPDRDPGRHGRPVEG